MNPRFLIGMIKTLSLSVVIAFISTACAGSKQQPISPPTEKKQEPEDQDTSTNSGDVDPFVILNGDTDDDTDDTIDDEINGDSTTDDSTSDAGINLASLLPLVMNIANGQMPDVNTILSLIPGGGGGALGGIGDLLSTGLLGGTTTP